MIPARSRLLFLALGICALAAVADASAQVRVDLALRRYLFIRYEPVVAIVTITNMTGGPLELADDGNHKWFSFHIEGSTGALVAPYNPDYTLSPVEIQSGQSIKRGVNITPLYPMTEYGTYRIRATVYDGKSGQYFSSAPPLNIEITEGKTLWQQVVGVPEGSPLGKGDRTITLLSHRLPDTTQLYIRIEDKEDGLIYCTSQIGSFVSFTKPDIQIDRNSQIHLLQNIAPRAYLYTKMDLNGKILVRKQFAGTETTRPSLRHDTAGGFQVVGGIFIDPTAEAAEQQKAGPPPSVSDRPVPLPKSQ